MQKIAKIAGIFKTPTEKDKFLQKLPNKFYAHSEFEVNDEMLTILTDKTLKNHLVVIVETPNDLLPEIYSLIEDNGGKYVEPKTLTAWNLKGID